MRLSAKIFSAIDVGSNAIRYIIAEMQPNSPIKVLKKIRVPIRLGKDVFLTGTISSESLEAAEGAFSRFKDLNHKFKVHQCRAVATSASREAQNGKEFVERIRKQTGINIEVIDGTLEGQLVHKAITHELDLNGKNCMGIDVGGGSVEVTFSQGESITSTQSFPLGTVRLLDQMQKNKIGEDGLPLLIGGLIKPLVDHVHSFSDKHKIHSAIGTGGNLESLGRLKIQLLKKTPNTFLTLSELHDILDRLLALNVKQRIEKLDMRPDRADVIVPAAQVVATIMRQAEVEKILIPGVGLRDGLLWDMFSKIP